MEPPAACDNPRHAAGLAKETTMDFFDMLNRAIRDADDLEWMYGLDVEAPPPARVLTVQDYPGGPEALITSRMAPGVLPEPHGD